MVDITKSYPNPVNIEALRDTVQVTYPQASWGDSGFRIHNITPENEATVSMALDTIILAHNAATLTTSQQEAATDSGERATLLQQAVSALVQIENDKAALVAAGSLAAVKPIVQNMLNREERIVKALRAIIRNGLS
jgi:5-deoxy-D-glucuronate isomerase